MKTTAFFTRILRWLRLRPTRLADSDRTNLLAEAKRRGYDTDKLIWVKQD